jgi:protein-L-isoaspartate(D-aspartate) O-methyltransferase
MMSQSTACVNMIKQQLRTNNITNEAILDFYKTYPRENFTPEVYKNFAYADMHIPLDNKQVMLTPLEEAKILQTGNFNPEDTILLLGSGNTYLTALLSQFCQKVVVVDKDAEHIVHVKKLLNKNKMNNVELMVQDSYQLENIQVEFDAIICTGAVENIPASWWKCLKTHGKLFAPIGEEVQNAQWLHLSNHKVTGHEFVFSTHLPKLIETNQSSKFIF